MRQFELQTSIRGSAQETWRTLVALEDWPAWNRLIPRARGELRAGAVLELEIQERLGRRRGFRPRVVSFTAPVELVLEAFDGFWRRTPSVKTLAFRVIHR